MNALGTENPRAVPQVLRLFPYSIDHQNILFLVNNLGVVTPEFYGPHSDCESEIPASASRLLGKPTKLGGLRRTQDGREAFNQAPNCSPT